MGGGNGTATRRNRIKHEQTRTELWSDPFHLKKTPLKPLYLNLLQFAWRIRAGGGGRLGFVCVTMAFVFMTGCLGPSKHVELLTEKENDGWRVAHYYWNSSTNRVLHGECIVVHETPTGREIRRTWYDHGRLLDQIEIIRDIDEHWDSLRK